MKKINQSIVDKAMSYSEYRKLVLDLFEKGKTTGDNNSEAMLNYTNLNNARMKRLDKTTRLEEEVVVELENVKEPLIWLVLTEGWCGDAAQILPILEKMAETNDQITLELILRDQNLEIMDAFLTNGGRSIPKVLILDAETLNVKGTWGPRPEYIQDLTTSTRKEIADIQDPEERKKRYQDLMVQTQLWYAKDKTKSTQREFLQALKEAVGVVV